MTFPAGRKAEHKNWPLIKRMAQWHVQGVRLADQMKALEAEGSKYGKRNAFAKFRNQNKKEINADIERISNKIEEKIQITAEQVLKRLWEIQEMDGSDRVKALERIQKQLGFEAVQKSEVAIDAPALTEELGRLLGATIK